MLMCMRERGTNEDLFFGLDVPGGLVNENVLGAVKKVVGVILKRVVVNTPESQNECIAFFIVFRGFLCICHFVNVIVYFQALAFVALIANVVALLEDGVFGDEFAGENAEAILTSLDIDAGMDNQCSVSVLTAHSVK
jgi:hypothetical protein